jgi:hypothetical protein
MSVRDEQQIPNINSSLILEIAMNPLAGGLD